MPPHLLASNATVASVPAAVVGVVLFAAVLHATWNAIAHAVPDQLVTFALFGLTSAVCAVPVVLVAAAPAPASWPFLATSAVLHTAYNLLLMRCYRLGEFSQVYPLARGTSPLLVALAAAVFAGETLGLVPLLGVVVISVGLGSLVLSGGVPTRAARPALVAALLTGVVIASYTTVDGFGVRASNSVAGYVGWLFLLQSPAVPLIAAGMRGRRVWPQLRRHVRAGLAGGLLSVAAYALVLWAQTRAPLAPVAALRETSVVVGSVIGTVLFHERFGRWRVAATVAVVTGVVLINL